MSDYERFAPRPDIKVLLVEDDEPTLELLSLFLGRFYSIITCSSGESALHALYTNADIDVIVTDLRMPGVNGFDVLRCTAECEFPAVCTEHKDSQHSTDLFTSTSAP